MKALRWHAALDVRVDDVPTPDMARAGSVVVEVAYCGVCGTDLHEYLAGPGMIRRVEHPLTGQAPPITLGHEFSGTVAHVADDVHGVKVGDRVAVDPCVRCGTCRWCLRGDYHVCARGGSLGLAADGGLARFVQVPAVQLVPVPDGVPLEHAALAEPLAVGLHAATRGDVRPGQSVLVLGAGPIGIASVIGAKMAGAAAILVSEPSAHRAEQAHLFGATEVLDPSRVDVRREAFLLTGRVGPDVVIEATGTPALVDFAIRTVRRGGHVVLAGISSSPVELDPRQLVLYERRVSGSLGYNHDLPRVLDLMASGRFDPAPLITGTRPLSSAPETFEELAGNPGRHLKMLIVPEEG
jgi:(R,R)-butanediol dehydrogenase/meso-butanediol dehydrogenase/diacetyl reductase